MSLNKPSLILVRNSEGRWNLEKWLPPARVNPAQKASVYGPLPPAASVNRLERIEFEAGRANFKTGGDKNPVPFTNDSCTGAQVSPRNPPLNPATQPLH